MEKKLPKMYHSSINKNIDNIQKIYSTMDDTFNNEDRKVKYNRYEIETKINNILNSSNFVYKANVNILTEKGLIKKNIIAKNNGYLITMENETIPINSIKDIYF